jgi:2-polyprenyl-6-methoxyphenol hydroxylase-like FAD-dependent oxidoreductase
MYTIIGGGIGGLTTALAFEKQHIDYQLFERAKQINEVGAGIWLAPNALQVMEWLGLLDEIRAKGQAVGRIQLAKSDFSTITDMEQSWAIDKYGFSTIAIHRAELQRILLHALPKNKVRLGKSLDYFEQPATDNIRLFFAESGQHDTSYLIGADGIHSRIRQQLFPASKLRYSGQTCWRGIANVALKQAYGQLAAELWGKQIRFGFSGIGNNRAYWFAVQSCAAGQQEEQASRKDKLLALFAHFHPIVSDIISHTANDRIIRNDIWDLAPMKQWHQGRACLIGDAAHATTPNMGQGAAQAIEDAYHLAYQIQLNPTTAFEAFQAARLKKVHQIVTQSWNIGKLAHWKYGRTLRDFMMSAVPSSISRKKMTKLYRLDILE